MATKKQTPAHVNFPGISPTAWEHPADRAALNALRRIPGFDIVLRKLVGLFGEKSIRLSFKANAVRVSATQYPWLHDALLRVCETLDVAEPPELYVSQTPLVNAGAVGFDKPFIILNSSTIEVLDRAHVEAVIGHEVGHILSEHAVYRTMLMLITNQALRRYPIAGVAITPIRYALLEWSRKAELSCDRAGLLAVQDPRISMGALMRIAGGARGEELNVDEFIAQAEEYRNDGDALDGVYKVLAALGTTHPFSVARVAELQQWIESGQYDAILAGEYRTRLDDAETPYYADVGDGAGGYSAAARGLVDEVGSRVGSVASKVGAAWKRAGE